MAPVPSRYTQYGVTQSHKGVLFNNIKNKILYATLRREHFFKWNKPDTTNYIFYNPIFVKHLREANLHCQK
jgi:hypothetical protein